ncbi:MAG TPA: carboxypeptidase regulatory-like domain-containing protein [Candidatus Angelobacter sp.]|nr:carboxypeptidase regulatory-like domain-containing protein [Candidatus Angelobacter sp.]
MSAQFGRSSIRVAIFLLVLILTACASVWAQVANGSMHGTVTDPSGAAVTKATVTITAPEGKGTTTTTNSTGSYEVKGLAAGKYGIKVTAAGFADYEVDGIDVGPGQAQKTDVALSIAIQQENVNVSDQAIGLDTSAESNVSQMVLSGKDLDALSDDPDELETDLQALAGPSAGPNGGQIYIDGFTGGQLPPKSSIREIRINQNPFSPQYDKLGYGRIEIFTKPGTDLYHGSISVNGNSSYFNSTSPFATSTPAYDTTQYTANFGGPVGKKASFFLNFERRNIGDNAIVNAYVLDPMTLEQEPFNASVPIPQTRTTFSPRMDFQLTPANTLSVRYQWWQNVQNDQGVGQFSLPSQAYDVTTTENTFQISDTQVVGTKIVNETRFQYLGDRLNQTPALMAATLNVQGAFVGGGSGAGYNLDSAYHYELQNYTSLLEGKHVFKFGARLRAERDNSNANPNFNGTFTFNSLDAYQITEQGIAAGWSPTQIRNAGGGAGQFSITYGTPTVSVNYVDAGLYFSDDWRWKPNFTISYGLRFETQTDIHDNGDVAPRFAIAWGLGKGAAPKTVIRAGWGMFYDRFAENYVLQAQQLNGTTQLQYLVNQPDFYPIVPVEGSPLLNTAKTFPTQYQLAPDLRAAYTMQTAVSVERQLSKNANLAVSYLNSKGVHQFVTVNVNAPLPGTYDPTNPASGVRPYGAAAGNIYQYQSQGEFEQNQLIVNANLRVGTKVSLFGWYTLNFVDANTNGAGSFPNNQYDLAENYGPTAYDVRNRAFIGGTVALPHGLRLNPFMVVSSGIPFNITLGQDYNGDSIFNDRPTFATPGVPGQDIMVTKWGTFNLTPLAGQTVIPPYYGMGPGRFSLNLRLSKTFGFGPETKGSGGSGGQGGGPGGGRGGPRGGGFGGMSGPMGLGNATNRRYSLTFSVNARNVFNNINYAPLVGNLSSPLFGQPNAIAGGPYGSSSAPRKIELQALFNF